MPSPDLQLLRQAAAEFQPSRRLRFHNLQSCREVILELIEKGASAESIAELLTRHGVKTSRTMVNEFVGSLGQPKRRSQRKPPFNWATPPVATPPRPEPPMTPVPPAPAIPAPLATAPVKTRGPRIAKIEFRNPE